MDVSVNHFGNKLETTLTISLSYPDWKPILLTFYFRKDFFYIMSR